jgi:AraC-like DNA-binding protein
VALVIPRRFLQRHDQAIEQLAENLEDTDLHVVFPKRMTSREEKQVDRGNYELFSLYRIFRDEEGMSRNKAIETAADHCGYGRSRAYEIVSIREGRESA